MRQITKDINKLKSDDIINILLYGLYRLSGDPEYASISELAYVLDKDSMYKLCATFGGTTLKVPRLSELKNITSALLIIELVQSGYSFDDAYREAGVFTRDKDEVLHMYSILSDIIEDYDV